MNIGVDGSQHQKQLYGAKMPVGVYPGQYYDSESGYHYNWHRTYNPHTGRYLTADPIGLSGDVNLFAYVRGNPITSYDYLGLYCKRITEWQRATAITNKTPTLTGIKYKGKWRKTNEWPVLPIAGRNMVPGASTAALLYGCSWKLVGTIKTSYYTVPILVEAKFKCGIDECPKKELTETRYKEENKKFSADEEVPSIFPIRTEYTFGCVKGSCQPPSY